MKNWALICFAFLAFCYSAYTQSCPTNFGGEAFVHTMYKFENRYYKSLMEFCLDTVKKNLYKGTLTVDGGLHIRGIFAQSKDYRFAPDKNHASILYDHADTTIRLQARFNGYYSMAPGSGFFYMAGKQYPIRISDEFGIWFRAGTDTIDNQLLIEHFKYLTENGTKETTTEIVTGYQNYALWYKVIYTSSHQTPRPAPVPPNDAEYERLSRLLDQAFEELKNLDVPNTHVSEVLSADINNTTYFTKTIYPARYKWEKYAISVVVPKQYATHIRYLAECSYSLNGEAIKERMNESINPVDFKNGIYMFTQSLYLPQKIDAEGGKIDIKLWYEVNSPLIPIRVLIRKWSY